MQPMKATSNSGMLFRLTGVMALCLAGPLLLWYFAGPLLGGLGAVAAVAFWYSRYRFPAREERGSGFWLVVGGYVVIGITLLACLGRLIGVSL
jgi:hypothetical protein